MGCANASEVYSYVARKENELEDEIRACAARSKVASDAAEGD